MTSNLIWVVLITKNEPTTTKELSGREVKIDNTPSATVQADLPDGATIMIRHNSNDELEIQPSGNLNKVKLNTNQLTRTVIAKNGDKLSLPDERMLLLFESEEALRNHFSDAVAVDRSDSDDDFESIYDMDFFDDVTDDNDDTVSTMSRENQSGSEQIVQADIPLSYDSFEYDPFAEPTGSASIDDDDTKVDQTQDETDGMNTLVSSQPKIASEADNIEPKRETDTQLEDMLDEENSDDKMPSSDAPKAQESATQHTDLVPDEALGSVENPDTDVAKDTIVEDVNPTVSDDTFIDPFEDDPFSDEPEQPDVSDNGISEEVTAKTYEMDGDVSTYEVSETHKISSDEPFAQDISQQSKPTENTEGTSLQLEPDAYVSDETPHENDAVAYTGRNNRRSEAYAQDSAVDSNVSLRVVKDAQRQYDTATFQLLDPNNENVNLRSFVQCTTCSALYTEVSWARLSSCLRCGGAASEPISVPPPAPLAPATATTSVLDISRIVDLTKSGDSTTQSSLNQITNTLQTILFGAFKLVRNLAITAILIGFTSFLSVHAYRIINLDKITVSNVLDELLRSTQPVATPLWIAAVASSLTVAFVFYPHQLRGRYQEVSFMRRIVRLISGIIILGVITFFLQGWNELLEIEALLNVLEDYIVSDRWRDDEQIVVQASAVVLGFVTTIIYRLLSVPFGAPPSNSLTVFFNGLRYVIIVIGIAISAATVGIIYLFPKINNPDILMFTLFGQPIAITYPALAAFSVALSIAMILFHRPSYNGNEKTYWLLRFGILAMCAVGFGVLYATTNNVEGLLQVIPLAAATTLLLWPIQRTFS